MKSTKLKQIIEILTILSEHSSSNESLESCSVQNIIVVPTSTYGWCSSGTTLTFDIVETGSSDSFTEIDECPLRLATREDMIVVCHSDDSMGSHGRYLQQHVLIGSFYPGWETNKGFQVGRDQPSI